MSVPTQSALATELEQIVRAEHPDPFSASDQDADPEEHRDEGPASPLVAIAEGKNVLLPPPCYREYRMTGHSDR